MRPKEYRYKVGVIWESERQGFLSAGGKPAIRVATPPEFKGHEGVWSPEDLFVAAQASCFMMTFLGTAYHRGLKFQAFEAEAEGTLARPEGEFLFTEILIKARVALPPDGDRALAQEILSFAEKDCLVTHSIVSRVRVEAMILLLTPGASAPAA
ncbi:MAG: OsmC family protein [Candidatus Tectomicrobia bacterium]|uniref:OsmC family protein n=1 Tax=Tectimicrobiota bacterium TaxID=2528274 RepID=A0A932MMC2_UNCTE|nr:OsmC family protein [Candidatus Tectomicrobia bacterium]